MMLKIEGGQSAKGTVTVSGAKNAALPIVAASLLFKKATLRNVPDIADIRGLIEIIESLGAKVKFEKNVLALDNSVLDLAGIKTDRVGKMRASILLLAPLLYRVGRVSMPYPGGCNIGKRPVDEHVDGIAKLGFRNESPESGIAFSGKPKRGDVEVTMNFMVTATENVMAASVLRPGRTTLKLAAIEPHVRDLADFLNAGGAKMAFGHDHTIVVDGVEKLADEIDYSIIPDCIEAGTFAVLGALAGAPYLDVLHPCLDQLEMFYSKMEKAGVRLERLPGDVLRVHKAKSLRAVDFQTNIYPGFPSDLQSPFCVLLSQAEGVSKAHEIMYEGRLNWLVELENMKGHVALMNPHQALVFGKRKLRGATVNSWDLRAGVSLVIAGAIAEGTTYVTNVQYIDRGYEDIVGKLAGIGIKIERVEQAA